MYNNEYMGIFTMQMISGYYVLPFLEYKKCYRYVKRMPLITKLHLMLLKISYYISVIKTKITVIY